MEPPSSRAEEDAAESLGGALRRTESDIKTRDGKANKGLLSSTTVSACPRLTSEQRFEEQESAADGSIMFKRVKEWGQQERQQQARVAALAAASEAFPSLQHLVCVKKKFPTSPVMLVRRAVHEVTLKPEEETVAAAAEKVSVSTTAATASNKKAAAPATTTGAAAARREATTESPKAQEIAPTAERTALAAAGTTVSESAASGIVRAPCGGDSTGPARAQSTSKEGVINRSDSSIGNVVLIDVSLENRPIEDEALCSSTAMRHVLTRGLSLLEIKQPAERPPRYVVVRRGLPKFYDLQLSVLAAFVLQYYLPSQDGQNKCSDKLEQTQEQRKKNKWQKKRQQVQRQQREQQKRQQQKDEEQEPQEVQQLLQKEERQQPQRKEQQEQQQQAKREDNQKQLQRTPAETPRWLKQAFATGVGTATLLSMHQLAECLLRVCPPCNDYNSTRFTSSSDGNSSITEGSKSRSTSNSSDKKSKAGNENCGNSDNSSTNVISHGNARSNSCSFKSGKSYSDASNSINTSKGYLEVWALQKLNGDSAQISFCKDLNCWACCSKRVCLLLPADAAGARWRCISIEKATAESSGRNALQQQHKTWQQHRQAVALLRLMGADRVVGQGFAAAPGAAPPLPERETYARLVAAAWQQQLHRLQPEQVELLKELLERHTLVGELLGVDFNQHIIASDSHQLIEQLHWREQHEPRTEQPRIVVFALVNNDLKDPTGLVELPPCLSPGVSLPLLRSLGLQTVPVEKYFTAKSPLQLLLQLEEVQHQLALKRSCDTEGLVLYFCFNPALDSCSSSLRLESSFEKTYRDFQANTHKGPVVLSLAKIKSAPYVVRRLLREHLKEVIMRVEFWQAAVAAAAAMNADREAVAALSEAFAAAAEDSAASRNEGRAPPDASLQKKTSTPKLGSAVGVEAALRVRLASVVGVYWSRFLEGLFNRFDHAMRGCARRVLPEEVLIDIKSFLKQRQQIAKQPKQVQAEQQHKQHQLRRQEEAAWFYLIEEEAQTFRRATAFCCSLAAALMLAIGCRLDPKEVASLWAQQQKCLGQQHKQQRQMRQQAKRQRVQQVEKEQEHRGQQETTVSSMLLETALPVTCCVLQGALCRSESLLLPWWPLLCFLSSYADRRLLDLLADSQAFAAATGAPQTWISPTPELLECLLRQDRWASPFLTSSSNFVSAEVIRVAGLQRHNYDGRLLIQEVLQLPQFDRQQQQVKCKHVGPIGHLANRQRQHPKKKRRTICLVAPPFLLSAAALKDLEWECAFLGCRLVLRHTACVTGCCCKSKGTKSGGENNIKSSSSTESLNKNGSNGSKACSSKGKDRQSGSGNTQADLVVMWGMDAAGFAVSRQRLQQLLLERRRGVAFQKEPQPHGLEGVVFVRKTREIMFPTGCDKAPASELQLHESQCLAVSSILKNAFMNSRDSAEAEAVFGLAVGCCNGKKERGDTRSALHGQNCASEEGHEIPDFEDSLVPIFRLPASLALDCADELPRNPGWQPWKQTLKQFVAGVRVHLSAVNNGSAPSKSNFFLNGGQGVIRGEQSAKLEGWQQALREHQGSQSQAVEASSRVPFGTFKGGSFPASVVALLPVGIPGSGKTTTLLEALRPAIRHELRSHNKASIGGVLGLRIWEARPLPVKATAGEAQASTTTTAAKAGTASVPFDVACLISSDEATGEALRSRGFAVPRGALYRLCCEEAVAAGATARLEVFQERGYSSVTAEGPPDEKTMKEATQEGRSILRKAQDDFFAEVQEFFVSRLLQYQQMQGQQLETADTPEAAFCCPLRVLLVVDRNHPPNAVGPRFYEIQQQLRALQMAIMRRCEVCVSVAVAAVLLPPDAAVDGFSLLCRVSGETPQLGRAQGGAGQWQYPWSREVLLKCIYRVLSRGNHATLSGGTVGAEELQSAESALDAKAVQICLSFFSCFRGYRELERFLRTHPSVDFVLPLQTVLLQQEQQQNQQLLQERQNQIGLLHSALLSLKPFSHPPPNQSILKALAAALRRCPPEEPFKYFRGGPPPAVANAAADLLRQLEGLFLHMEGNQGNQQHPQHQNFPQLQHHLEQHVQQRLLQQDQIVSQHHQQHSGKIPQNLGVTPHTCNLNLMDRHTFVKESGESDAPSCSFVLRLPRYFSVNLEHASERLSLLSQQILAIGRNWWGPDLSPETLPLDDVFNALQTVNRPHVTTFFLGGGTIEVKESEIEIVNKRLDDWMQAPCQSYTVHEHLRLLQGRSRSEGRAAAEFFTTRMLRLHQLLASRRQVGTHFRFRVTHLVFAQFGLACAALSPCSSVLPLADPQRNGSTRQIYRGDETTIFPAQRVFSHGVAHSEPSLSSFQDFQEWGYKLARAGIDESERSCGLSCASERSHQSENISFGNLLCIAADHYAHVTLCLCPPATAVMSNDVLEAVDKAIRSASQQGEISKDTPRPFRTGAPCNYPEVADIPASQGASARAYGSVDRSSLAGGSDFQELLIFSGVPVNGKPTRLWVWCVPSDEQEELEGPLQAS